MIRLHLLGFTPDLKGLVFSGRRGGRTGTYWVPVDEDLWKSLEQLEGARAEREQAKEAEKASKGKAKGKGRSGKAADLEDVTLSDVAELIAKRGRRGAALPEPEELEVEVIPRVQSKLSPREVQQLLREGRSVRDVAAEAGVEEAWVERFMGPVLHERTGVISMIQGSHQERARLGRSGVTIGDAVLRNLQDRKATQQTLESIEDGWDAKRTRTGIWRVRLRFTHRGKRRSAEWEFTKETKQVRPRNELARELGWWMSPQARLKAAEEPKGTRKKAGARKAKTTRRKAAPRKSAKRTPPGRRR